MSLRRLRIRPRSDLLLQPTGEGVSVQDGTPGLSLVGGSAYPNLPSGWTILSDRDFLTKTDGGWTDRGDANFEIVTPATDSMASQSNRLTTSTGRARYNLGFGSGSGPIATSYTPSGANQLTGLYLRFNGAVSSNWYGESSGVNKIYFLAAGTNAGRPVYLSAQGALSGGLTFQVRLQGAPAGVFSNTAGGVRNLPANTGSSASITRGTRFTAEVILRMNTCQADGTPNGDGTCEVWFNDVKTHNYTDVCYRGNGSSTVSATARWNLINWNPTWGGNNPGETVPATQYMYMYDAAIGVGT